MNLENISISLSKYHNVMLYWSNSLTDQLQEYNHVVEFLKKTEFNSLGISLINGESIPPGPGKNGMLDVYFKNLEYRDKFLVFLAGNEYKCVSFYKDTIPNYYLVKKNIEEFCYSSAILTKVAIASYYTDYKIDNIHIVYFKNEEDKLLFDLGYG